MEDTGIDSVARRRLTEWLQDRRDTKDGQGKRLAHVSLTTQQTYDALAYELKVLDRMIELYRQGVR